MISITIILLLFWLHFVADFVFQADNVAIKKSSDNVVLTYHVLLYILPFAIIFGPMYALINGALHFVTDYFSSRLTTKLYKAGERHWFFVVIGLDQALHYSALFLTYYWIFC